MSGYSVAWYEPVMIGDFLMPEGHIVSLPSESVARSRAAHLSHLYPGAVVCGPEGGVVATYALGEEWTPPAPATVSSEIVDKPEVPS